jgi:pimeloyl-ACP methyl ester carboxylesterase
MKKRIFLLPGFGEDTFAFDELASFIKGYTIIGVDYRPSLNKFIFPVITRNLFAKKLIEYYGIGPEDKLVGHSMGGYFAGQIRELQGNEICMIAAFSDPRKIKHVIPQFPRFSQVAALTGFVKSDYSKKFLLNKVKEEHYRLVLSKVLKNFHRFSNIQLALMSEMYFEEKIDSYLPNPLRIHDRHDRVVLPPDEAYIQVNGGHFCLNLYPEAVFQAMKEFLE